jgi:hypothetical protein
MEATLMQALEESRLRSTVDECVREMVTDVEWVHRLEEELAAEQEIQHLTAVVVQQEWALAEARAGRRERAAAGTQLADGLVRELGSLAHQMGELEEIKQQHQKLLVEYDGLVAKLMQTEEDLEQARMGRGVMISSQSQDLTETVALKNEDIAAAGSGESIAQEVSPAGVVTSAAKDDETVCSAPALLGETEAVLATTFKQQDQTPTTAAVVSLEHDSDLETPSLEQLDTKIILMIFAYLDALDILNTAQVNICMYSRVDSLFGLGSGQEFSEDVDNSTIATVDTSSSVAKPAQPAHADQSVASAPTATTTTTATIPAKPVLHTRSAATTTTTTPVSVLPPLIMHTRSGSNEALQEGIRGIFSMLQPRKQQQQQRPATTTTQHVSPPRGGASRQSEAAPMNAQMANSMAAKLSDAELNAIIIMTDRLRSKEVLAEKLADERDSLLAKLDGTESVKQFLVTKVRDMEKQLASVEDNETKVAQQIASDQEVIGFLDGKIQELEGEAAALRQQAETSVAVLARVQEQAEQKAMVMGDMLQFERERWNESEREWKATRKVLIKEVKNCRAQIVALQAERDGYREQNDVLRKALLSSPSNSRMGSSSLVDHHHQHSREQSFN